MRLKEIELKNFRNHKETKVLFEPLNLIIGNEGAGKSSIRYAIQVALTGDSGLPDTRELVKKGEDEARVKATFIKGDSERVIEKIIPRSAKKQMRTNLMNHNALLDFAGVSSDVATVICSTSSFMNMKREDRIKMISKLVLGEAITLEAIKNEILKQFDKSDGIIIRKMLDSLSITVEENGNAFKDLEAAVSSEKKAISNKAKAIEDELSLLRMRASEEKPIEKSIDITKIQEWMKKKTEVESKRQLFDELSIKLSKIAENKEKIKENTKLAGSADETITVLDKLFMEKLTEKSGLDELITNRQENIEELNKKILEAPDTANPEHMKCQYFGTCQLSSSQILGIVTNKEIGKKHLEELRTECRQLVAKSDSLSLEIEKIETDKKEAKNTKTLQDDLKRTLSTLIIAEEKTMTEVTELSKIIVALDIEIIAYGLDDSAIKLIEDQSTDKAKIEIYTSTISTKEKELESISNSEEFWGLIAKDLKPTGVKSRMTSGRLAVLEQIISNSVRSLAKIENTTLSSEMDIICNGIPIDYLSDSEKYKACLAIQRAISEVSSAGIIIIDNINMLVDDEPLIEMIKEISKTNGETIILISADQRLVGRLEECNHIMITNGSIVVEQKHAPDEWEDAIK